MSPRQRTAAKETPFTFSRGKNPLKLDWPLKTLLHDKRAVWELLAARFYSRVPYVYMQANHFSRHLLDHFYIPGWFSKQTLMSFFSYKATNDADSPGSGITGSLMFHKTKLNVAYVAGVSKEREREF